MTSRSVLILSLLVGIALPTHAQNTSKCPAGQLQPLDSTATAQSSAPARASGTASNPETPWAKRSTVTNPKPAVAVTPTTKAESVVQDRIETDGLHVVHFWAPWCQNSIRELKNGWGQLVARNPNVTFTFVTVWNDNEKGAAVLDKYDLPDRVVEVTQPDLGPSSEMSNRRHSFLSLPVTWIPSTWIFHKNGELAFALNYGEMEMDTIQSLLDATRKSW